MNVLYDTNVYFALLADPAFLLRFGPLVEQLTPATFRSSVVVAELLQGARGEAGRARIRSALRATVRAGRLATPSHADWTLAGRDQSQIWDRHPDLRTESFLHDALIAASARRIGATVVTWNVKDFETIAKVLPHDATTPEALIEGFGAE